MLLVLLMPGCKQLVGLKISSLQSSLQHAVDSGCDLSPEFTVFMGHPGNSRGSRVSFALNMIGQVVLDLRLVAWKLVGLVS